MHILYNGLTANSIQLERERDGDGDDDEYNDKDNEKKILSLLTI